MCNVWLNHNMLHDKKTTQDTSYCTTMYSILAHSYLFSDKWLSVNTEYNDNLDVMYIYKLLLMLRSLITSSQEGFLKI